MAQSFCNHEYIHSIFDTSCCKGVSERVEVCIFYRIGVMTKIGDIEEKVWIQYAEELIRRFGDEALFKQLKSWYKETTPWLRDEKDLHRYSLECFVARIFDNPNWVDYAAFNRRHRPEVLQQS